ncbi:MAG TPA: fibronectin type III domain-containing protein [Candidatus Nitrosotalea sp.]|nr:fibronectin type III domain-containing protein [Candidatus Nitrosotalea sp.]
MVIEHKNSHNKYFLTLVFASIFLFSFGILIQNTFADGPTACYNQYDDPFTSFIINNGTQTFDVLANPGIIFDMPAYHGYNVTFAMHTPNTSSWGNSNPGATWYGENAFGIEEGACVSTSPNENVTISIIARNPQKTGGYVQSILWSTAASSSASYYVRWLPGIPTEPLYLTATTVSSSQIDLDWNASGNGGSPIIGYKIERSADAGNSWSSIVSNTHSTITEYDDTGLSPGVTYTYRVSAINSVGTSLPSNVASATTLNTVPSSPTGLNATGKITHIDLSWTTPNDNGGTSILGYVIQRSTDNGTTWSTIVSDTNSTGTTYADSHLIPVKVYTYCVFAINSVGTSDPSNTVSVKPLSIPHNIAPKNR